MSLSSNGIPSDTVIEILTRLPSATAVARCRCVSTSWRSLLSDPDFLLKIFLFDGTRCGGGDRNNKIMIIRLLHRKTVPVFSLRSADALMSSLYVAPIPLYPHGYGSTVGDGFSVAGYSEGIFCITVGWERQQDVHLWNPATSETKLLPRPPPFSSLVFGFDPKTSDFKVVRVCTDADHRYTHVYSLRNGSWGHESKHEGMGLNYLGLGRNEVEQPIVESKAGRCYLWHWEQQNMRARILCYDLTREALSVGYVAGPRAKPGCRVRSMSISKGFLVAITDDGGGSGFEVWVAMGFGESSLSSSLLKVFDVVPQLGPEFRNWVPSWAAWADNKCFYLFRHVGYNPYYDRADHATLLGAFDVKTGRARDFGARSGWNEVRSVVTYVGSEVSLSSFD
ncbi:unnamed protein product [Linum tenue]|uniref:F-box domain-containing protein n=1 Tax=Linum tenue TaxID=586396 RepID=A0AAV0JR53_9ROSI|nr:unnamed protein product [Linum tenue]